jgi:hypothetical protein
MSKENLPEFDPKNLEVLAYIKGDPNCKRCFDGRGYTGITLAGVIIPCRCAVVKEPMTAKIMKSKDEIANAVNEIIKSQNALRSQIEEMESSFIRTKIIRLFTRQKK